MTGTGNPPPKPKRPRTGLLEASSMRYQRHRPTHDVRYSEVGNVDDPCVYCGAMSTGWDHVPSIAAARGAIEAGCHVDDPRKYRCCPECNTILGTSTETTVTGRRQIVRAKLRIKYATYLKMPQWDAEDLSEMEPRMAQHIRDCMRFAIHVRQRISGTHAKVYQSNPHRAKD